MTPEELHALIVDGPAPDTTDWAALVAAHGTPILTDDPERPDHQRALFVWIEDGSACDGVYVWVNRLTDKRHVDAGLMRRAAKRGLWFAEIAIPRDTMATYRIYPYTATSPGVRDGRIEYSREVAQRALLDPNNTFTRAGSTFGSVLSAADAPDLSPWAPDAIAAGLPASTGQLAVAGTTVRYRYAAPTDRAADDLLVVFDAEKWFGRHRLPDVLAQESNRRTGSRRFAVLGIDSPSEPAQRLQFLGGNRDVLGLLANDLIPRFAGDLASSSGRVVLAGQSLGGLAALTLGAWYPEVTDEIIVYSPSVWWRPGLRSRPADVAAPEPWLADQLTKASRHDVPIRFAAGRFEEELAPNVTEVADTARRLGHPVSLRLYSGGHDDVWWAALMLGDLTTPIHIPR